MPVDALDFDGDAVYPELLIPNFNGAEPDNLPLLCWHHHHTVHEQHWSIEPLGAGHFQLISLTGVTMPMSPPLLTLTHAT